MDLVGYPSVSFLALLKVLQDDILLNYFVLDYASLSLLLDFLGGNQEIE